MAKQQVALANPEQDEHAKLITWVNEADDATIESRALSEKSRDYYDSKQWTAPEVAKLKRQKQAATVVNRIKPKMDGLMGMERANKTTAKAQPRTPKHTKGALAATEATRFVLQDNFYDQKRSQTWDNLLLEGTGGMDIIVRPNGDDFDVIINHIMWDRIIYDPHSRRKDFSDARFLGQVVWMDYDEAVAKYPKAKDVLETMQTGSDTYDDKPKWMDNTRRRVKIVELYYRKADGEVWYACFTRGGYCEGPKKSPYLNEDGETEWCYEFASLFVDREGIRYGAARQLLDVQDEVNKRRSKALHLMSVRQVRGERGAVEDVNKARAELAKPDGYIETTPGMEFEILKTGDMAAAQFNLLTEAKAEIDSVSYNAAAQGKDHNAVSGVALRTREQAAQTELAPMFDVLKNLDVRVYRKVWNRIRQYWKAEKWIRVTDDENNLKFVGLNKPMTKAEVVLEEAANRNIPPEQLAQLKAQVEADPMMQGVVDTANDVANLDVDIIMDDAPDTVTQQVEDFQAMAEMVKSGFPMPPEAVIEASPLSNKDKIIKMMKEQPQKLPPELQKKIEQIQEQAQELAKENEALKRDQSNEQAKIALKAQDAQRDTEAKRVSADNEHKARLTEIDREKEIAIYKANVEAATKIRVAKIGANASLDETAMKVDAEANMELMQAFQETDGESLDKPIERPIDRIQQMHAESQQQHTESMQLMAQMLAQITQGMQSLGELVAKNQGGAIRLSGIRRDADGRLISAEATRLQ